MKILCVMFVVLSYGLVARNAFSLAALDIMQRYDELPRGDNVYQENALVNLNNGKQDTKLFSVQTIRQGASLRSRFSFTSPTKIEFLVWDDGSDSDTLQWIKMSSGRVRKISSSDKANSWMNSSFFNEDLSDFDIDDYSYELLGETEVAGEPCYKVKSINKRNSNVVYSQLTNYVSKNDFMIRRIEFYRHGKLVKNLSLEKIENIDGVLTPRKMVMSMENRKSKSIIYVKSIKYDAGISDLRLTREAF